MPPKPAAKNSAKASAKSKQESKPPAAKRVALQAAAALVHPQLTAAQKADVLIEALP